MVGNGKAVGLLLNGTDQSKDCLGSVQSNLSAIWRHQGPGSMFVVLHHSKHRKVQFQGLQRPPGRLSVGDSTVNQQEIRRLIKARIFLLVLHKTAVHHLCHGRIVVLILQTFHLESLILFFIRFSV